MIQRRLEFGRLVGHSDDEHIVLKYLESLSAVNRYCVDIAAQDGVMGSQTLRLFQEGWSGLAVEFDGRMFAALSQMYRSFEPVSLVRTKVVPHNVVSILEAALCPRDFGFLSLDIDSYDYYVLDQVLSAFRPRLICVEINETVPPPLKFTVTFSEDHQWGGDHFQGQSICKCHELCVKYDYEIVELYYNNLFLMPVELNVWGALTPEAAYDAGYRLKTDRQQKFPWNADMEDVLDLSPPEAIDVVRRKFAKYVGRYTLE
ncbi:MAG: hypothetical protein ACR2L2_16460 [Acidobacteriota bacterium]